VRLRALVLVALGLLPFGLARGRDALARPDPTPAVTREEVTRLLSDLASDRWQVREAAMTRLRQVAREARPFLLERKDDADPEVRRAVAHLLSSLGDDGAAVPVSGPGAPLSEGLVTLAFRGTTSEALKALDALVPGRVRLPTGTGEATVEIAAASRPYFEVLDAILSKEHVEVAEGAFDDAGQANAAPESGEPLAAPAYAGAFRLDVHTISAVRSIGRPPRTTLGLRLRWAPCLQVVSNDPPLVVAALDAAGRPVRAIDAPPGGWSPPPFGRQIGGASGTPLSASFEVGGGAGVDRLSILELRVRMAIRRERREARFELGPDAKLPATLEVPGAERGRSTRVTLESFETDPERRGTAVLSVAMALGKGVASGSVVPVVEGRDGRLRSTYASGARVAGPDGSLRLSQRVAGVDGDAAPVAVRVIWFEREEEHLATFVLKDVPLR
jgi:hypothetical protein